jgi:predicted double-glycine peptidase
MVLAALSDERSEADWAALLGSYDFGTPSTRIRLLAQAGYHVQYGRSSLDELQAHLERGLFPIVFVRADLLPWADYAGFHTLVLVEVTPTDVALLDPALDHGPTRLARDGFLIAWEEFDCLAAVISK